MPGGARPASENAMSRPPRGPMRSGGRRPRARRATRRLRVRRAGASRRIRARAPG